MGAACSSPLAELCEAGGGQSRARMPSCRPVFPRLWCQRMNGEVQGAWGPGLPAILQPAGTVAKALRLQETTELGGGWGLAGTPRKESPAGAGAGIGQASGMMSRPTRGLSSPRPPHKGLVCTVGCEGLGAARGRGGCSQSPSAPSLCSLRKGSWARPNLSLDLLSEVQLSQPLLGSVSPTGLSLASFPALVSPLGFCPGSCPR